jgi:uncharacterized protein YxeA
MRKALGLIEILFVLAIVLVIYLTCFNPKYGRANPFADNQKIKTQQQLVDDKLNDISDAKALRQRIEKNLNEGY